MYSSLDNGGFGNIDALASKFKEWNVEFIMLSRNDIVKRFIYFFKTLARARVLVIDASSPAAQVKLNKKTCLIHCWHACGAFKKNGFDAKRKYVSDKKEEKRIKRIHRDISYFVCTSEHTAEIYAKAFRLSHEKMLVMGSPRLDACMQKKKVSSPECLTVLYAPTYRTCKKNTRILPHTLDMEQLQKEAGKRWGSGIRLAFRGHPTLSVSVPPGWEDWSSRLLDEALAETSILITDYSSVFFDFLPYRRPIVFFVPDIEEYQKTERELYFSPYDEFPETTCKDMEQLIHVITAYKDKEMDYSRFWDAYMSACDGHSAERICAFILEIMKRGNI